MQTTSATLLSHLKRTDDPRAWGRFVRLYSPLLYSWAGTMGLQDADALDLVQDVFTTLVQKIGEFSYDSGKGFRKWLFIVTKNKYLERMRRRRLATGNAFIPERTVPSPIQGVEEADLQSYFFSKIVPTMRNLFQPSTWQAFWQQVIEEKPAEKVAQQLGISVKAVYKAKTRVMTRLHQELDAWVSSQES